ncbi:hypothetical protein ACFX11_002866 [Malus domestica]
MSSTIPCSLLFCSLMPNGPISCPSFRNSRPLLPRVPHGPTVLPLAFLAQLGVTHVTPRTTPLLLAPINFPGPIPFLRLRVFSVLINRILIIILMLVTLII